MNQTRREMFATAGAAAALAAVAPQALAAWEPAERYPDPAIQTLDPAFNKYRIAQTTVERIARGCRWNEGPVWFGDGRCLLWSDIPNKRIMQLGGGNRPCQRLPQAVQLRQWQYARPPGPADLLRAWRRRITRTEYDGTITVLMDKFDGKPLNSPNDIVVKSDDSIWFTDPPFGILANYEGAVATPELPSNLYRFDPRSGQATAVTDGEYRRPNGLAFSPDESKLYVVESERDAARDPRLRRGGRRDQASPTSACSSTAGAGRHAGWLPRRQGRQSLVRLGHGRRRSRTASWCSTAPASRSAGSRCRSAAPTCASAA